MIESTADRLATEYKVSAPTIKRDGQYAAAVDSLASVGVDAQSVIAHASKADVIELAKVLEKPFFGRARRVFMVKGMSMKTAHRDRKASNRRFQALC